MSEYEHIAAPAAQRRQRNVNHVDPEKKVLAKGSVGHGVFDVAVRGRDDSNIHRRLAVCTDGADLPLLQSTKELGLQAQRHAADFVQEERSTVSFHEQTPPRGAGIRERTLGVSEQFTFEETFGNAGAVDRNERLLISAAAAMQGMGNKLLSGSRFPGDKHGGLGIGQPGEQVEHAVHRWAVAHKVLKPALFGQSRSEAFDLLLKPVEPNRSVENHRQGVGVDWLRNKVVRSDANRSYGRFETSEGRNDDHGKMRMTPRNPFAELQAVHPAQVQIRKGLR